MNLNLVLPHRGIHFRKYPIDQIVLFAMRAGFVYMILGLVSLQILLALPGSGQELDKISVTVELQNESLNTLFNQIQSQTNLLFAYQQKQLDSVHVTITKGSRTVKETLDLALKGTSLNYRAVNNSVIIFKDAPVELPAYTGLHYVSGRVVDKSGSAIPGVNVVIRGTSEGTVTDAEGKYMLQANESDLLGFSFIGFKRFETEVGERTVIDVTLEEDVAALKEVVINGGYYETTDELKTGSIVKVTAKDIEKQPVTSPLMALQGRVPGLEITPSSGAPGVAPKIRIRGTNSLRQGDTVDPSNDGNYPLYIIDGVPISSVPLSSFTNSFTAGGYDPLSTLNPSSIESIEVLKDGDATAIYGARGANGVILITTKKKVKEDGPTVVDVSAYAGVGTISRQMPLLDTKQYLSMRREALSNNNLKPGEVQPDYDLLLWDTTKRTNWQKVLLGGTANITDVQSGISSGTRNTSFRFSGGYHRETMVYPGDFGYYRISGQLTINHTSSDKKLKMTISSIYGADNGHYFNDGGMIVSSALRLPPNAPRPFNDDGTLNWERHDYGGLTNASTWDNPFSYLKRTQDSNTKNNISNVNISYELLPGLLASASAGYTDVANHEQYRTPTSSLSPSSVSSSSNTGSASFVDSKRTSWIVEPKLSWLKTAGGHKVNIVAGTTWQNNSSAYQNLFGRGYASEALLGSLIGAQILTINADYHNQYKFNSVYTRVGYGYKDKYLINLTGRRDGSSRFGPGKRFGNFASIGAGWIFSNESFVKEKLRFMNFGKLRASYGLTGSDNIGEYNYYNLYDVLNQTYGGRSGIVPYALYNPNYSWEETRKTEVAVELAFADNKIGVEVNWYQNRSSNQLVNYPLSNVTGFESVLTNFNATIQNSGWEAIVRADLLNSNSWRWNASVNVSLPANKLVSFDGIENSPYATIYRVGEPLSSKWLYTWKGVNPQTGLHEFVDQNNDGVIDNQDRTIVNLSGRIYYGGIANTIQYKSLELSFNFQFSHQQGQKYLPEMPGFIAVNQPSEVLKRWTDGSHETEFQKFTLGIDDQSSQSFAHLRLSTYNTTDASFVRLKTLSLTWRLPQEWLNKAKLQEAKVFAQGQNLLTFTPYQGLDPETGNGLPPLRMVTAGIQLKF